MLGLVVAGAAALVGLAVGSALEKTDGGKKIDDALKGNANDAFKLLGKGDSFKLEDKRNS
ncbi:MAG: hypothetical protein K6B43_14725 [Treponema sp.]|nr:hypothetical protein [Treponema sp.]